MTATLTPDLLAGSWPTYPNDVAARHLLAHVARRSTRVGWLDEFIRGQNDDHWIAWHNLRGRVGLLGLSTGETHVVLIACDLAIGSLSHLDDLDDEYRSAVAAAVSMCGVA